MVKKTKINWKSFTFRQKMEYIWDYYRIWIAIILGCAILGGHSIYAHLQYQPPLMNVVMMNTLQGTAAPAAAFYEFLDAFGYQKYDGAVSVHTAVRFVETKEAEYQNYHLEQLLFALATTGEQELLFGNGPVFFTYAQEGMLMDLSSFLPEETLTRLEDSLLYSDYFGEEQRYPCALLLTEHPFMKKSQLYDTPCYVGIFYNADQPQIAQEFLSFLLSN